MEFVKPNEDEMATGPPALTNEAEMETAIFNLAFSLWRLKADKSGDNITAAVAMKELFEQLSTTFAAYPE